MDLDIVVADFNLSAMSVPSHIFIDFVVIAYANYGFVNSLFLYITIILGIQCSQPQFYYYFSFN